MNVRLAVAAIILLTCTRVGAGTFMKTAGQVIDGEGKPVVGARIAELWFSEQGGLLEPSRPALSGTDGRFSLEIELHNRDTLVMAVDATGTLGGVATVFAKEPRESIKISLAPLVEVRGRYTSERPDRALGTTHVTVFAGDGKLRAAAGRLRDSQFQMKLSPGQYTIHGEENRHVREIREFTLKPGNDVDLGAIGLKLSPMARLFGELAPPWHFTDARGLTKSVQPADFKGKWVVLEFWGYWCGPCIHRGLPGWMDFVADHAADSDKFAVLAIHDPQAADFAMLDEKFEPIIRRAWHGRSLPFPVLLDTTGRMVKDYGIERFPTAVLLDPEGRVVDVPLKPFVLGSCACEDFLASKLTPLSAAKRIASALDRGLSIAVDDDQTLAETLSFYGEVGRIAIRLDAEELSAAGIDKNARVPLSLSGSLTLRAWLNLTLEPFGLTYVAEGDGLRVVPRSSDNLELSQASPKQTAENVLVASALEKKASLEFQKTSLKQVVATLASKTGESFVLDPACRKWGAINPDAMVTGSANDVPLASALDRLLGPLGITLIVKNEAVILTTAR